MRSVLLAATAAAVVLSMPAFAQDIKLPPQLSWTAYDTGSSGFNMAVAIGQQFKKYGADVRVLAAGNDTARLAPLRAGRAAASAMGTGVFFAQEGLYEFGNREWGPQSIRLMMTSISCNGATLGAAKDSGVKEAKDLKGKRVGVVVGSPALTQNALAIMAFGGLTAADVKLVEFSSYGAMWKGVLNNDADAAFASTISAQPKEVETSPRGLVWIPTPAADKAGWDRLLKVAPWYSAHKVTCGAAGLSKDNPLDGSTFAYPIVSTYGSQSEDLIYSMTKAMIVEYPNYKDATPGADGFNPKTQTVVWAVPFHTGAVKALKEIGVWTEAAEKNNQSLLKRQQVLSDAWKAFIDSKPSDDGFLGNWMKARSTALQKAGFDPLSG